MTPLPDGTYDAVVVDASDTDDGAIAIELTITAGPHKGDVLALRARSMRRDPLSLLGDPATIEVRDGKPHVTFG